MILTNRRLFILFALLPFAGNASHAADYCLPTAKLSEKSTGCVDNEVLFSDAAVICLDQFTKDVDAAGQVFHKSLVGGVNNSAGKVKKQQGMFAGSEQNYNDAAVKLAALIATGHIALAQVEDYKANLTPPEDIEIAADMGFTVQGFLRSIPCFEDNRALLSSVAEDFRERISDLEKARNVALKMKATSAGAKKNIDKMGSIQSGVKNTIGVGSGVNVKSGKSVNGQSDITGIEEDKAKSLKK